MALFHFFFSLLSHFSLGNVVEQSTHGGTPTLICIKQSKYDSMVLLC